MPQSSEEIESFIIGLAAREPDLPGAWYHVGIVLRESNELIGDCGLHVLEEDPSQIEFGITVAPPFRFKGFATESMRAIFGYVFDEIGKRRRFGSVHPRNDRSVALMLRLGLRQEAHLVERIRFKGEWADEIILAMLGREWRQRGTGADQVTSPTQRNSVDALLCPF